MTRDRVTLTARPAGDLPLPMLVGRVLRIFRRYADGCLSLARPGGPLVSADGQTHGRLDRIALVRNRLHVEGWSAAPRIGLRQGRHTVWTRPELARPGSDWRGFALDVPFEPGPFAILAEGKDHDGETVFAGFGVRRVAWRRGLLFLPYLLAIAGLVPVIWRWKRHGDLGAREVVKERLYLTDTTPAVDMDSTALFGPVPPAGSAAAVLVMPVYNAFDTLTEALERVAALSGPDWRLIAIEDGSTDPQVRPWLRDWAAGHPDHVTLLENDTNLGFIATVNRGLTAAQDIAPDLPVVLVNSDALVPEGWLPRLLAPLADADVASVTPWSNDAEIFTVPAICARHDLPVGLGDALDRAARALRPQPGVHAPTGVGFCMALGARFLRAHPQLDTAFGRGYGEETDWCQKARAMGGVHLCATDLFVEHRGGQSFGSADKARLLEKNGAEIRRRYPRYDAEVQDFIRADPLAAARLALGLSWAALSPGDAVPVYLAHAMGGGADHWLRGQIAQRLASGGAAVVLRVGQGRRWRIELHAPQGITQGLTEDLTLVEALIDRLPRRRVIYSCGVGDRDALELPGLLLRLAGHGGADPQPVEVMIHDFFPLSPSYTLLGADGVWHGPPLPGTAAGDDPAHVYERPGGARVALADWQAAWGALMAAAERVTVFSDNSRRLVAQAYPQAEQSLIVRPHPLPAPPPRIAPGQPGDGVPVLAALGNIGAQKGAAVLARLSRDLARSGQARLVVIGHIDPDYALAAPARVHGSYELRDLPGLVARYGVSAWLIPSIWPETFSFTTHEALATGLPVIAFDLGAQGDAVARAVAAGAPGAVLPMADPPRLDPGDLLTVLETRHAAAPARNTVLETDPG